MRTKKDWAENVIHIVAHVGADGELERQIERIQLDAYRAGGLAAAEKLKNKFSKRKALYLDKKDAAKGTDVINQSCKIRSLTECLQDTDTILTHFNNLKELPE